ncbi:MAG TPA: outer membrane lipoprotein carrier protein LolA [Gemmatimonadales bacterium]
MLPASFRFRRARAALTNAAVVVAAATLVATPAAGQGQSRKGDVDAILARAAATYNAARTATARFEQTLTNPMTGTTSVSRGEFARQQPDRFSFRFTDPAGDRIVADGSSLWIYTPSATPGQVIKLPLTEAGAGSLDLGAQFFASPKERFVIADAGSATVAGRPARVLTLTPRKAGEMFTKATVWLDAADGTLRQFETVDGMGIKRRVVVRDLEVNVPVKAATFTFTPPKGVRVVDRAALTGGR